MKYLIPLALIATLFLACNPTQSDIQKMVQNGQYDELLSLIQSDPNTKDLPLEVEITASNVPSLYEQVMFVLAFGGDEGADYVKNKHTYFDKEFAISLTHEIIDRNEGTPEGFQAYVRTAVIRNYSDTFSNEKVKAFLQSNPEYVSSVKHNIINESQKEGNVSHLLRLVEFSELTLPDVLVSRIQNLSTEIDSMMTAKAAEDEEIERLESRINYLEDREEKLSEDYSEVIKAQRESYTFEGYMVSLQLSTSAGDVYEVRNIYNANPYLLTTKETKFTSKGVFSLKVYPNKSIPVKLNQQYGGFTRDIPVIIEYTDKLKEEFDEYSEKYKEINSEKESLQNKLETIKYNLDNPGYNFEEELTSKKESLKEAKEDLAEWIRNN